MKTNVKNDTILSMADMQPHESQAVIELLAAAMCTNPINQAVFLSKNATSIYRQKKMFGYLIKFRHNRIRVAKIDGRIAGVMCCVSSDHCKLTPWQMAAALPSLLFTMKEDIVRFLLWRMNWSKNDYPYPHVHLGPIAVDPAHQGQGIGTFMLNEVCKDLDEKLFQGYLETDKRENVVLYEKFGFKVIRVDEVLGVTNWFMARS
jgi:ribosomal protein S18 acetylase RimI-like enzyme